MSRTTSFRLPDGRNTGRSRWIPGRSSDACAVTIHVGTLQNGLEWSIQCFPNQSNGNCALFKGFTLRYVKKPGWTLYLCVTVAMTQRDTGLNQGQVVNPTPPEWYVKVMGWIGQGVPFVVTAGRKSRNRFGWKFGTVTRNVRS